jgi:hypothetical protein
MNELNIEKVLNQQLTEENNLLRKLVKVLLRDFIGDLCFTSNKSKELALQEGEFKEFLKIFLNPTIDRLDKHYSKLLTDNQIPFSVYEDLFNELKNPVKELNNNPKS